MELSENRWPFTVSGDGVSTLKHGGKHNRLRALGVIARNESLSQQQLARALGLQASTTSNIVRDLKKLGVIQEGTALASLRAGPKAVELKMSGEAAWGVGVELDPDGHRLIAMDAAGTVLKSVQLGAEVSVEALINALAGHVKSFAATLELSVDRLAGIGVSVPGAVDAATGTVLVSHTLKLSSFPLGKLLAESCPWPVWVERNVNCGAYAEHYLGVAREQDSFIYLHMRSGPDWAAESLGLTLITGEKIFRGCNSAAGEIDRNFLRSPDACTGAEKPGMSEERDNEFREARSRAFAAIINLLDVDTLVLSSSNADLTTARFAELSERVSARLVPVPGRRFNCIRSQFGPDGMIRGAALLAVHRGLARQLDLTAVGVG